MVFFAVVGFTINCPLNAHFEGLRLGDTQLNDNRKSQCINMWPRFFHFIRLCGSLGEAYEEPRLTCWFGQLPYSYSNSTLAANSKVCLYTLSVPAIQPSV